MYTSITAVCCSGSPNNQFVLQKKAFLRDPHYLSNVACFVGVLVLLWFFVLLSLFVFLNFNPCMI